MRSERAETPAGRLGAPYGGHNDQAKTVIATVAVERG